MGRDSNGGIVAGSPGSQPFLTQAQRAAMDAAIAAKQQGPRVAKKGGGGGKYTWGAMLQPLDDEDGTVDRDDPSYVSDEDDRLVQQSRSQLIRDYKRTVAELLEEYLDSGDIDEAAQSLQELDLPRYDHWFVKRAITLAMDRHDREREMVSVLLSALYSEVVSADQMARGLHDVLDALDDLTLDVPDAADQLATFVARAVVDDILPPSFVSRLPNEPSTVAGQVRAKCKSHLGAPHAAERLLRCWGSGAGLFHGETKDAIGRVVEEYVASRDLAECARCLQTLAVPWFHHELVKQALHRAMANPSEQPAMITLLQTLSSSGCVSELQLVKGFQRVVNQLGDTALDMPHARERFAELVAAAKEGGWLDDGFAATPDDPEGPSHSIKAFKTAAVVAVKEYLDSGDWQEVATRLLEMGDPGMHHLFVKHAVVLALDRKDRERELISTLLVALCPDVLTHEQVAQGFSRLLACVEDACLDTPDAPHLLSRFLGRAVVDELLPPSFLTTCLDTLRPDAAGVDVVKAAVGMLGARHAAERLATCWYGGATTVEGLREAMQHLVKEYSTSGDLREAAKTLLDMDVPHYHHELVRRVLLAAFDAESQEGPEAAARLLALLRALEASGEINQSQMHKGFARVEAALDDVCLDCPRARELLGKYKQQATEEQWLLADD